MCSYSTINGQYACENSDILGILEEPVALPRLRHLRLGRDALHGRRRRWPGSTWRCPAGPCSAPDYYGPPLKTAVQDGQVPVSALNDMVSRILLEMFRFGLFDHPQTGSLTATVTTPAHAQTGRTSPRPARCC